MKRIFSILVFTLFFVSAFACKPKVVMKIQHTPCFGKCADFTVIIYSNGLVEYDGGLFSKRLGKAHKKISKKEVKALAQQFRDAKFFEFKDA